MAAWGSSVVVPVVLAIGVRVFAGFEEVEQLVKLVLFQSAIAIPIEVGEEVHKLAQLPLVLVIALVLDRVLALRLDRILASSLITGIFISTTFDYAVVGTAAIVAVLLFKPALDAIL